MSDMSAGRKTTLHVRRCRRKAGVAGAEIVYEYGPATVLIRSNYIYVAPDGSKYQLPLRNNFPVNFPGYCPDLTAGELPTNLVAQTDNDQVKVDITNDQVNIHSGIVITLPDGTHSSTTVAGQEIDSNGNICCIAGRPGELIPGGRCFEL